MYVYVRICRGEKEFLPSNKLYTSRLQNSDVLKLSTCVQCRQFIEYSAIK